MENTIYKQAIPNDREPPRRHRTDKWKSFAIAVLLLGGLVGILVFILRDQLTPAIPVRTGRVILLIDSANASPGSALSEDELLFQASGWLEPDPWPIKVAALTDGFVEDVFFKAGEAVTNGHVLARLDAADAELALREAVAGVEAASAQVTVARDRWERIRALPERDTTPSERVTARNELAERQARLSAAEAERDTARLARTRTEIRSPMDGIVLRRFVDPGSKRGRGLDDPNSAVIASLFDPTKLQVRVDVPLAEAGRLFVGQPTRITTAMLPGQSFTGRVTRIVGEADLQRNTLQAKVEVRGPDPRMRPEVLCRVEFRGGRRSTRPAGRAGKAGRRTLWVPESALVDSRATEQDIWVVDPVSSRVERRTVRLGTSRRDGYRRVLDGLRANETVVVSGRESLTPGRRITSRNQEDSP